MLQSDVLTLRALFDPSSIVALPEKHLESYRQWRLFELMAHDSFTYAS